MSADQIITVIGLIGIGGLLKSAIDYTIDIRKSKQGARHTFKETRYKAVILLCFACINYEKEKIRLIINRPDIDSTATLKNELHAEWINMAHYASDSVVNQMKKFLEPLDTDSFNNLILFMRKDLYGMIWNIKEESMNEKVAFVAHI